MDNAVAPPIDGFKHDGADHGDDVGIPAKDAGIPAKDTGIKEPVAPDGTNLPAPPGTSESGTADVKQPAKEIINDPSPVKGEPVDPPIDIIDITGQELDDVVGGGGPQKAKVLDTTAQPTPDAPVLGGGNELPFTGAETWVILACAFLLGVSGIIFKLSARKQDNPEFVNPDVSVQYAWRRNPLA